MQATLTSKGQITLPVALRRKLHLKAGDVLKFDENSFRKAMSKAELKRMRSTLGRGKMELKDKSMKEIMDWLRGPSDYEWCRHRQLRVDCHRQARANEQ